MDILLHLGNSLEKAGALFLKGLSNKYLAFLFISFVFVISYLIFPVLWKYIFTALISYFAATIFMRYLLYRGVFRARHSREGRISEGHRFMVFVCVIILATIFSDWLAGYISNLSMMYPSDRIIIVAIQTIAVLGLVFLDLEFEI